MKNPRLVRRFLTIAAVAIGLSGCELPAPATPTYPPTNTPVLTVVFPPTDTPTPLPSETPTDTPSPTSTATPSPTPELIFERLKNPDFEQGFNGPSGGGFVGVFWDRYVFTNFPVPRLCEEGQTEGCNPPDTPISTPEFKDAAIWLDPFRVLSGAHAQQFFKPYALILAGVGQTFETERGEYCDVTTWAQVWLESSEGSPRSCWSNDEFRSDWCTQDEQSSMHVLIVINPDGEGIEYPWPDSYIVRDFGFEDGIYDQPDGGAPVISSFIAQGELATVAFMGYQEFPTPGANWYFDLASVRCSGGEFTPPTQINP